MNEVAVATEEFWSIEYDTVVFDKNPDTGLVTARRVKKWTVPSDHDNWQMADTHDLSAAAVEVLLNAGKLRQTQTGQMLEIKPGKLSLEAVVEKLDRPITDEQLADLNVKLARDFAMQRYGRPCCPNCWSFGVQADGELARCRCGWRGPPENLHRRPAQ